VEKLVEALQAAIQMERRGRETYLDAADNIKEVVAKTVLLELANDEEEHELMITSYYHALQNHQGWPAPQAEDRPLDLPDRVREMLEKTAAELTHSDTYLEIYETALDLERQSRDFYLARSNVADDRRLIEFFRFLARVEETHAKALEILVDGIKGL
jgi:rubrerythrin